MPSPTQLPMSVKISWPRNAYQISGNFMRSLVFRYKKLNVYGKAFILFLVLFYISLATFVVVVTPNRIAQYLHDKAQLISQYPLGWLALGGVIVLVSFPPATGHTTLVTLCGFAYGMWGFLIGAAASLVGSCLVFLVLRRLFSKRLRQWSASNTKWKALESVVEAKGLPLIILIRASPFPPWVYSNTLFASIEATAFWQFAVATCFVFPKILLHTFIGARIAAVSDGDQRDQMDTATKIVNGLLIGGGILLAIVASGIVYRLVRNHVLHLEGIPPDVDELAAEVIEDIDEGAPLLRNFPSNS